MVTAAMIMVATVSRETMDTIEGKYFDSDSSSITCVCLTSV